MRSGGSGRLNFDLVLSSRSSGLLCGPPIDIPWSEAREGEDRMQVTAVGAHPVEPVAAVILEAEDDPLPVGGVGADVGPEIGAAVVRQVAQASPVGPDGGDVRGP